MILEFKMKSIEEKSWCTYQNQSFSTASYYRLTLREATFIGDGNEHLHVMPDKRSASLSAILQAVGLI
jgi:hypothetical protein